jgi:hypothetical protein
LCGEGYVEAKPNILLKLWRYQKAGLWGLDFSSLVKEHELDFYSLGK